MGVERQTLPFIYGLEVKLQSLSLTRARIPKASLMELIMVVRVMKRFGVKMELQKLVSSGHWVNNLDIQKTTAAFVVKEGKLPSQGVIICSSHYRYILLCGIQNSLKIVLFSEMYIWLVMKLC